jgi:hypothetical protein
MKHRYNFVRRVAGLYLTQASTQPGFAAGNARHHGPNRYTQRFRDLAVGELV